MQTSATAPAPRPFTERNAALIPVWLVLSFNIYWVFWAYKTYREMRDHSPHVTTITPGAAVGFLFIPFFNVFWFFRLMVDLPRALARMQAQCAPQAAPLPRGHLSAMLMAGLVFNVLAGYIHPGMFVAGEILLVSAFVALQVQMNEHNRLHQGTPVAVTKRDTVGTLVGASSSGFDGLNAGLFTLAVLLSFLAINVGTRWAYGGGLSLDWRWAVSALSWAVLTTAGGLIAFRFLRQEWLAAVVASAVFAAGMMGVWALLFEQRPSPSGAIGNMAGQFLWFGALILFLRVLRPLGLAVLLAGLVAEFGDNTLTLLYSGQSWYASFAMWVGSSNEVGSAAWRSARAELIRPFLDVASAVLFAGVMVVGRRLRG